MLSCVGNNVQQPLCNKEATAVEDGCRLTGHEEIIFLLRRERASVSATDNQKGGSSGSRVQE
jgi:hypothetical protein